MAEDHDREELLKILESHGQQFLSSFSTSSDKKRKHEDLPARSDKAKSRKLDQSDDLEFEDWDGFNAGDESDSPEDEQEDSGMFCNQRGLLRTNSMQRHQR